MMEKCFIHSVNVLNPLDIVIARGLFESSLSVVGLSQTKYCACHLTTFVVQNGDRCAVLLYARTLKDHLVLDFTGRRRRREASCNAL